MKIIKAFLAVLCCAGQASPQFYMGTVFRIDHFKRSLQLDDYWQRVFSKSYKGSLEDLYKEQQFQQTQTTTQRWFEAGLPKDYFRLLLQNNTTMLYDQTENSFQTGFVLGAYLFRKQAFLMAVECPICYSFFRLDKSHVLPLFQGNVPDMIENACRNQQKAELNDNGKYCPLKTQTIPLIYFGGTVEVQEQLSVEHSLSLSCLFRIGCVAKKRFFVFGLIGPSLNTMKMNIRDRGLDQTDLVYYYNTNTYSSDTKSAWSKTRPLQAQPDLGIQKLSFQETQTLWGVTGGIGAEFFLNSKVSFRAQALYEYTSDAKFLSTNGGANIFWSTKGFSLGTGIFVRF